MGLFLTPLRTIATAMSNLEAWQSMTDTESAAAAAALIYVDRAEPETIPDVCASLGWIQWDGDAREDQVSDPDLYVMNRTCSLAIRKITGSRSVTAANTFDTEVTAVWRALLAVIQANGMRFIRVERDVAYPLEIPAGDQIGYQLVLNLTLWSADQA